MADLALSPDGQRLVVLSPPRDKQLTVYNFITWEEEYKLDFQTELTCVTISRDSKYMLLNLVANEIQLIDITTAELVRIYRGQKQGEYVIRSTFGGADDNLVISGSEGTLADTRGQSYTNMLCRWACLYMAQGKYSPNQET